MLVYGVPDSSPYAIFASVNPILTLISSGLGYLGGMIEAGGKPGCTVIMAAPGRGTRGTASHHASYPEVWERVLAETRDPYEITARYDEEFARQPGLRRGVSPPLRVPPDPRHPRHPSAQAAAPRRAA